MYVTTVPTCLHVYCFILLLSLVFLICILFLLPFLFFLFGNYLHVGVAMSSNGSSIKCINFTSVFSITTQRKAQFSSKILKKI